MAKEFSSIGYFHSGWVRSFTFELKSNFGTFYRVAMDHISANGYNHCNALLTDLKCNCLAPLALANPGTVHTHMLAF